MVGVTHPKSTLHMEVQIIDAMCKYWNRSQEGSRESKYDLLKIQRCGGA